MSQISDIIDLRNRKILYQLDLNCRQSNGEIAKKIGISKDAVGYRIKQMEKDGVIRGYSTVIDSAKLGFTLYRVYLNLIDTSPESISKMIEFLQKDKSTWWIARLDGIWDFIFGAWVKSNAEFREFYAKFCSRFRKYIKDSMICPLTYYRQFSKSYLLGAQRIEKNESIGGGEKAEFDKKDIAILSILSKNARAQLIDISAKINLDSMAIFRRIKKLEEKGIIQGYRVDLNLPLLKRDSYSVKISLKDYSEIEEIEKHIKNMPEMISITEAVGGYDIEFDIEVENSEQYFRIMDELEQKFASIREITYFRIIRSHKILYMPEI